MRWHDQKMFVVLPALVEHEGQLELKLARSSFS